VGLIGRTRYAKNKVFDSIDITGTLCSD